MILSLGTAVPPHSQAQMELAQALAKHHDNADTLLKIFRNSEIEQRYSVIADFAQGMKGRLFDGPHDDPGMTARNAIYKEEAPKLAALAAERALEGMDRQEITDVISATCTGMMAPGIEFLLIDQLGLRRDVERLGINFMGCFGAFKGLAVARALAEQGGRVLVVCTELCSLHFRAGSDPETFVGNALFADGAAAAVVGHAEERLWSIERSTSFAIPSSLEEMTWEASDTGYLMRLTKEVPLAIRRHIAAFAKELTGERDCDWPVHPGGKAILHVIKQACSLQEEQLAPSRRVFARHGNMSSPTFLFVLDELRRQPRREWAVGLGFGPGLSVEGILLKK